MARRAVRQPANWDDSSDGKNSGNLQSKPNVDKPDDDVLGDPANQIN